MMLRRGVAPDLEKAPERVAERGSSLGVPMHLLASTTSTNDEAKHAAKDGAPSGSTWVAEEQTAGRGRQGRVWESPRGENLLFSVLVRVTCPPSRLPPIALAAGLAVRDALALAAPEAAPRIKWPNDVLIDGKKIAGVLVEAITAGSRVQAVVIGVGINVHARDFPEELRERATSLALASSMVPDRAMVLADVLGCLDRDLHVVVARGLGLLRARLEAADALRGQRVGSDAGDQGMASGIDDEGRLLVRRDDGVLARWSAGEVHLIPV
ncbi:MAG TPA: biotin--[acetyl-CoA-carboxylase] ligase [Polyangiaceae bacterium]|jgi:BirA family biotin operon repressor/biotin-[acetyl-CoA-carboxylase] ligase